MTTYVSQPDATDGYDTYLNGSARTTNYGTATVLWIGVNNADAEKRRIILKFDLTKGINPPPRGAVLKSAVLTFEVLEQTNARTYELYRCLRDWVESEATFNVWSAGNNWTSGGAGGAGTDYDNTGLGNVAVTGLGTYSITLNATGLAIVQNWVNGVYGNYGWVMRHTSETSNDDNIGSSDNATPAYRPKLVIEYSSGGGVFFSAPNMVGAV